jgi:N-acetylmuramoyl-L-alanine amidase
MLYLVGVEHVCLREVLQFSRPQTNIKEISVPLWHAFFLRKTIAMRDINKIIIHCSATPEGKEVSVDTIRGWHVNGRGWSDIGYHFVVQLDGSINYGRDLDRSGAHTKGHNKGSIGICYIGGVEEKQVDGKWIAKDTRTPEQKEALLDLLKTLKRLHPEATINGHREYAAKACPCFDANKEYKLL